MILFLVTKNSYVLRKFSVKNYFRNNFYFPKMHWLPNPYQEPIKARFIITLLRSSVKHVLKIVATIFEFFFKEIET